MPAVNKVGTQLLLSPHTRDRARALAIVMNESVAEVYRMALEGAGLKGLERQHHEVLKKLADVVTALAKRDELEYTQALGRMLVDAPGKINALMASEGITTSEAVTKALTTV